MAHTDGLLQCADVREVRDFQDAGHVEEEVPWVRGQQQPSHAGDVRIDVDVDVELIGPHVLGALLLRGGLQDVGGGRARTSMPAQGLARTAG